MLPTQSEEGSISGPKTVPYYKLFSYADAWDYLLMIVGGLAAIAHGASIPVFLFFFAGFINAFGRTITDPTRLSDLGKEVPKYCLYLVYLSCARFISGWLEVSLWMCTGDRQSVRMRVEYMRALIMQDVGFFDTDTTSAQIVVSISSDAALVQDAIGSKTGNLIHYMAQFVSGLIIAFASLWQLTLVTTAVVPVIVVNGGIYAFIMVRLASKGQISYVQAGEIAQEAFSHIRTVQSFLGVTKACKAYSEALLSIKTVGRRSGLAKGFGIGYTYGFGFASFALLVWYAGTLVQKGKTNGGLAFATMLIVFSSCLALGQAAPHIATISKAKVSGYTILEMIKRNPITGKGTNDCVKLRNVAGRIDLQDVTFSYPARLDKHVFQKLTLTIPAGEVAAIVGSSGSGKSTIISLIERFYDPDSGNVLLDGQNIKNMNLKWLRKQMGLVNQEPALFAMSILENIMYGKDGDVSMDEVVKAASISRAHDFIQMLPEGYETQVGEGGAQLSGGQKQRIAIARAVIRSPAILLLDEATSALDAESEMLVQEALNEAMVGRTTVVVAHRLSTIQDADMIAVLQEGRVVEVGSHTQLSNKDGAYSSLLKLQNHALMHAQESAVLRQESGRSISQRPCSLLSSGFESHLSNADLIVDTIGLAGNLDGLRKIIVKDPDGSRPSSFLKLMILNSADCPYASLGALAAIVAGTQLPLFALIITGALEYLYSPSPSYMKKGLEKSFLFLCGLGVLNLLAFACEFYFSAIAGENITMRIRTMMFSAILRNEISWFDENNSILLASCLSVDAPLVRTALVDRTITLLQNLGLIMTALVVAFKLQWKIALVMTATLPALVISNAGQMQFSKGFGGDLSEAYLKATVIAGEAVSNIRTVAAFCAEDKLIDLFSKEVEEPRRQAFARGQVRGLGFGISEFLLFSSYGLALWYASELMQKGEANFGEAFKCFMVLMISAYGMAEALSLAPEILKTSYALHSVLSILERQSKIDALDMDGEEVVEMEGAIAFRHVDFSYPTRPDVQIFNDFNLNIESSKSIAIVGASGSGKSSIIALIARFYDLQNGQVMVDGKDIRQLQLMSLRQHIGLVQQEPALFNTSILENILYGKEGASEAEVMEAAKAANAHNFICGLPDGYKTQVGERGVQLSGGQKQRVAIARAVLRNPAILLLDEATSALDAESEKVVQEALERVMKGRTTVLVAHRLTTIQNADSIAVLQNGRIVEQGSHSSLLTGQGAYFELLKLSS